MKHGDMMTRLEWPFIKFTWHTGKGKLIYAQKCPVPKFSFKRYGLFGGFFELRCRGFTTYDLACYLTKNSVSYVWDEYRRGYYTHIYQLHVDALGKAVYYREAMK